MSFNPISIEDEAGLLDHRDRVAQQSNSATGTTTASATANATVAGGGTQGAPIASNFGPFTSNIPVGRAAQMCLQRVHLDFSWSVPFPQPAASPLLYFPKEYRDLLSNSDAVGVMQAELDAMSDGVLRQIPLGYYLLKPGVVDEVDEAAAATERLGAEARQQALAAGRLDDPNWSAPNASRALAPEDAALLDTDLDGDVVLRRDLPSLTLLQLPLYTDMGLVPQEERHSARLARIIPEELRQLSQGAGLPGSPLSPASPIAGGALTTAASMFETEAETEAKRRTWREEVGRSFRHARAVDATYDGVLQDLVHGKLGLNQASAAHVELGRTLWQLLFTGTSQAQQRGVWHSLCRFSFVYDGSAPAEAERGLLQSCLALRLPAYHSQWRPLLERYTQAVRAHVATLRDGAADRKSQLHFSDVELDPQHAGPVMPEIKIGAALSRLGKERGDSHTRLPIFPVEVIPVFPSAFDRAVADGLSPLRSAEGELDYLAESADQLHHVVLPGATVPEAARSGPHVLVGDTNLLVADTPSTVADVQAGSAVSFHTVQQNTFEALFHDEDNTSSYILRVHQHGNGAMAAASQADGHNEGGSSTTAALKGALSKEGRYITYDRVGWRDLYTKAPNVRAPPFQRHVLVFEEEEGEKGEEARAVGKRGREEDSERSVRAAEAGAPAMKMKAVKIEPQSTSGGDGTDCEN